MSAGLLYFAFALMMVDGYDMFNISFLMPLIARELSLSHVGVGQIFAAGLAGSMLGGMILGPLADRVGRRPVLTLSLVVAGVATILCSTVTSFEMLVTYRIIAGFALGGLLASVIPLVGEHFPKERRSVAVTTMFIGFPSGAVVGGILTSMLIRHGWRTLFVGTGFVTLLALPTVLFLKESLGQARSSVDSAAGPGRVSSIRALVAEGRLLATACVMFSAFCMLLVLYLLNSWAPMIAVSSGMPAAEATLTGVFLNLGGIIGAAASTAAVKKWGLFRTTSMMVALGAIAIAALGQFSQMGMVFFAGLFLVGLLAIGGSQNAPAIAVDVYPQRMRATGAGWQFAVGRLGAIVGPLVGGQLLAWQVEPASLFVIVAIPTLLAAVAFALIGHFKPADRPEAA